MFTTIQFGLTPPSRRRKILLLTLLTFAALC